MKTWCVFCLSKWWRLFCLKVTSWKDLRIWRKKSLRSDLNNTRNTIFSFTNFKDTRVHIFQNARSLQWQTIKSQIFLYMVTRANISTFKTAKNARLAGNALKLSKMYNQLVKKKTPPELRVAIIRMFSSVDFP